MSYICAKPYSSSAQKSRSPRQSTLHPISASELAYLLIFSPINKIIKGVFVNDSVYASINNCIVFFESNSEPAPSPQAPTIARSIPSTWGCPSYLAPSARTILPKYSAYLGSSGSTAHLGIGLFHSWFGSTILRYQSGTSFSSPVPYGATRSIKVCPLLTALSNA